jgi:hypothetical protein
MIYEKPNLKCVIDSIDKNTIGKVGTPYRRNMLWKDFKVSLSKDFISEVESRTDVENKSLNEIFSELIATGKIENKIIAARLTRAFSLLKAHPPKK